ncbi:MAG: hypothetical protein GDA55_02365 [Cellvibrionales bacterium]|nr:hypothetical protein [Cellvibrionales bacterium]
MNRATRAIAAKAFAASLVWGCLAISTPAWGFSLNFGLPANYYSFLPAPAQLRAPTVPSYSTGTFTVQWQADAINTACSLAERSVGTMRWTAVPNTSGYVVRTPSVRLTRAAGEYEFALSCFSHGYGPVARISVGSVSRPSVDPLAAQLKYRYQVKVGDLNYDGRKDLYLRRTSGGTSGNGALERTILVQNASAQFSALSTPSAAQLRRAAAWPLVRGVSVSTSDLNVDGFVDVTLKGLSKAITGMDDQILYSTGKLFKRGAQAVTAVDKDFKMFFRDLYKWLDDPNYFRQAITSAQPGAYYAVYSTVSICRAFYGFPICSSVRRKISSKYYTLASLALSATASPAQQRMALAQKFGLDSYERTTCLLRCYCTTRYDFFSGARITTWIQDLFVPVTIGPSFDAVNYSKKAYDMVTERKSKLSELATIVEQVLDVKFGDFLAGLSTPQDIDNKDDSWTPIILHNTITLVCEHLVPEKCGRKSQQPHKINIRVIRNFEGRAYSGKCQKRLNYTSGTYTVSTSRNFQSNGVTIERGGPDSYERSNEDPKYRCTDVPKRIPKGNYGFRIHNGSRWKNVPGLETAHIGRTDILIHSGEGARGTIGCIIVGKRFSYSGIIDRASSTQALNEIRAQLNISAVLAGTISIQNNF